MDLQEILDQIDARVPNGLSTAFKCQIVDQKQRERFQDYKQPDGIYRFQTAPGIAFYSLPVDMELGTVRSVTVDNTPYPYRHVNEEADGEAFWTVVQGQMMLYPTPTKASTCLMYYTPRPNALSENNLDAVPALNPDFHMVLVYDACAEVAKINQDVVLSNNYSKDAEELADKARRNINGSPKPRHMRPAQNWR